MSIDESFKQHGKRHVRYNPQSIIKAVQSAHQVLRQEGERPVTALLVAAVLVRMHAKLSKTSIAETLELLRTFIAHWEEPRNMPKA